MATRTLTPEQERLLLELPDEGRGLWVQGGRLQTARKLVAVNLARHLSAGPRDVGGLYLRTPTGAKRAAEIVTAKTEGRCKT